MHCTCVEMDVTGWDGPALSESAAAAVGALEDGRVLVLPHLDFELDAVECNLLSPQILAGDKNVSYNTKTDRLSGTRLDGKEHAILAAMIRRFSRSAQQLVRRLLPRYNHALVPGRTSFRPADIATRRTSWRKDDTRLHVDSFPSSPVRGDRILRVFANVNPDGGPRVWRIGEPLETVAQRFLPSIPRPWPGGSHVLKWLHITKSRRSLYDHYMLQLHDCMKADLKYQAEAGQTLREFQPGETWVVFTDHVSHAATAGQHVLEQTYYLPVTAMADAGKSPLCTLERLAGRSLV